MAAVRQSSDITSLKRVLFASIRRGDRQAPAFIPDAVVQRSDLSENLGPASTNAGLSTAVHSDDALEGKRTDDHIPF
jgi:hypothetical protein